MLHKTERPLRVWTRLSNTAGDRMRHPESMTLPFVILNSVFQSQGFVFRSFFEYCLNVHLKGFTAAGQPGSTTG